MTWEQKINLINQSKINQSIKSINQSIKNQSIKKSFNFGPNKQTTKLLFSRKINSNHHSKLTFDSNQIRQYSSQKHFGLILDKKKT